MVLSVSIKLNFRAHEKDSDTLFSVVQQIRTVGLFKSLTVAETLKFDLTY